VNYQHIKRRAFFLIPLVIFLMSLNQAIFSNAFAATGTPLPSRTATLTRTPTPTRTPTLSATERTQTQAVRATSTANAKATRFANVTQTAEVRFAAATATSEQVSAQRTLRAESIQQTMAPFTATAQFKAEYKSIPPLELADHADSYEGEKVVMRVRIYDFNFLYDKTVYGFLYGTYKSVFVKPADWSSVRKFRSYDIITVYGVVEQRYSSPWIVDAIVTR
jgi:hypothetical protein